MASEVGEKSGPYSSQGIGNRRGKSSRYSHSVQQPGLLSNGVQADTWGMDYECGVQYRHSGAVCECRVQCRQVGGQAVNVGYSADSRGLGMQGTVQILRGL